MITSLIALHDLKGRGRYRNSPRGLDLHRQAEDARARRGRLHRRAVRRASRMRSASRRDTIKIGIMDEERRTTVNLKECIRAAQDRVVFINTGFLDRTGDEIHTSMEAGPDDPQGRHEGARLDPGLRGLERRRRPRLRPRRAAPRSARACGRCPTAWPTMLEAKIATRWPAPAPPGCRRRPRRRCTRSTTTRSTSRRARRRCRSRPRAQPRRHPLAAGAPSAPNWPAGRDPAGARQQRPGHPRLRRALGRPGRRLLEGARHQRCRPDGGPRDPAHLEPAHRQLAAPRRLQRRRRCMATLERMAAVVDGQNAGDPAYRPMAPDFDGSIAFQAACDLVFKGARAAVRLHRADPPPAPARGQAQGGRLPAQLRARARARAAAPGGAGLLVRRPRREPDVVERQLGRHAVDLVQDLDQADAHDPRGRAAAGRGTRARRGRCGRGRCRRSARRRSRPATVARRSAIIASRARCTRNMPSTTGSGTAPQWASRSSCARLAASGAGQLAGRARCGAPSRSCSTLGPVAEDRLASAAARDRPRRSSAPCRQRGLGDRLVERPVGPAERRPADRGAEPGGIARMGLQVLDHRQLAVARDHLERDHARPRRSPPAARRISSACRRWWSRLS